MGGVVALGGGGGVRGQHIKFLTEDTQDNSFNIQLFDNL